MDLWDIFIIEANECLDRLGEMLDDPERMSAGLVEGFVDEAFRIMHNLKGAAGHAGASQVEQLAHAVEDVLSTHRKEGSEPAPALAAELRQVVALMHRALEGESLDEALPACLDRLAAFAGDGATPATLVDPVHARELPETLVHDELPPVSDGERARARAVRIEASRLDRLMSFAGELLAAHGRQKSAFAELESFQGALLEYQKGLSPEARVPVAGLANELELILRAHKRELQRFGYVASDFGAALKRARMLPLKDMLPGWRRVVNEAANQLGRQVRFVGEVGDSEIDRQILDGLREPLMHVLRNAVDHGIETPAQREAAGKSPLGTVKVRARSVGTKVELEIVDDGRGFDLDALFERAVAAGLTRAEARSTLSPREIADFAFSPGLSTAAQVSRISGRGVGLDVVRKRISSLGGTTSLQLNRDGHGACLRIGVPVTLVSSRGLQVTTGAGAYVIPAAQVERALRISASDLVEVDGGLAVELDEDEPLRLKWLSGLMRERRSPDPEILPVVVVSTGDSRLGLVVEKVQGEIEYVNKGLPWNVERVPGVAGAVILGGGGLASVVDVKYLSATGPEACPRTASTLVPQEAKRSYRVLVADDSLTSRTLERNILSAAGYEVTTVVDGQAAWNKLQEESFDLLVSDVEMPKLDGIELTRRVRASESLRSLPVVLVTSLFQPEQVAIGSEAGADEYIVKGQFDQRLLLEAVARLL